MINDNRTTHKLKIKAGFDGEVLNFFTNDGPPHHEIRL